MRLRQNRVTPVVALTYVNPKLEVVYLNPVVAVTVDERRMNRILTEDVNQIDLLTIAISKGFVESAAVADQPRIGSSKTLVNSASSSDVFNRIVAYSRLVTELLVPTQDLVGKGFGKGLLDAAPPSDAISNVDVTKQLDDSAVSANDQVLTALSKIFDDVTTLDDAVLVSAGFNRTFEEAASTTEVLDTIFGKGLLDAPEAADSAAVDFSTSKADAASPDDVLANLLLKPLSDGASLLDQLDVSVGYAQLPTDSINTNDTFDKQLNKGLLESVDVADLIGSLDFTKSLQEAAHTIDQADVNAGDGLEWSFGTGVSDSVDAPTDTLGIDFSKSLSEAIAVTDEILIGTAKFETLADVTGVNESAAVTFTKALSDTANISELLSVVFDREGFTDTSSGADATTLSVSKALTDAKSSSDAGLLFMTDYADITYFAEDYVGSSRTF